MEVLVINKELVQDLLTMPVCIRLMEDALRSRALNEADQPLRNALRVPDSQGLLGMMPAYSKTKSQLGIKIVSVFPDNHEKGLPSHMGVVLLFDGITGKLLSIQDGEEITAIRTAAASALATDLLASQEASVLAIIGAGVQGYQHIKSIKEVRQIDKINIWSRNQDHANSLATKVEAAGVEIVICDTVDKAAKDADIICTTTSSQEPVLFRDQVKPGTHINAVGACTPNARELEGSLVKASKLFTDCKESLENEAGDYLIPLSEGAITAEHFKGEIGDIVIKKVPGRTNHDQITIFESLGIGVEDLNVADYLYHEGIKRGVGQTINL